MTMRRASTRILALSRLLDNLAELYPTTLEHLDHQLAGIDSYPKKTPGASVETSTAAVNVCECNGRGCDTCTPVNLTSTEAGAEARLRHSQIVADLDAGIHLLDITIRDLVDTCQHELRTRSISEDKRGGERRCDCSGREGALVPLTEGGWADPRCNEHAAKAGLCTAHYFRERRWRISQGLPTRGDREAA